MCPNCNIARLEVRNNNYYCPNCRMYIGPANKPIQSFSNGITTSRWQLQNQNQIDNSIKEQITDKPEVEGAKFDIKKYLIQTFVIVFIGIIYFSITISSNYFSLSPFCDIKIEEKKEGFKKNTIKALDLIKEQDPSGYSDICKYVSNIVESACPVSDEGNSGSTNAQIDDHCYVKGSKVIYLNNTEHLKQLAEFSKDFWQTQ